jgi:hypothetical protein
MVTNIDNYSNNNLFGYNELSSIYAPSRSYLLKNSHLSFVSSIRKPGVLKHLRFSFLKHR